MRRAVPGPRQGAARAGYSSPTWSAACTVSRCRRSASRMSAAIYGEGAVRRGQRRPGLCRCGEVTEGTWRMRSSSRRWCSPSARSRACAKRSYSSAGTRHRSRSAASARFSRQNRAVCRRCSGLRDTVTPSAPPAAGQVPQQLGLRQHQPPPLRSCPRTRPSAAAARLAAAPARRTACPAARRVRSTGTDRKSVV